MPQKKDLNTFLKEKKEQMQPHSNFAVKIQNNPNSNSDSYEPGEIRDFVNPPGNLSSASKSEEREQSGGSGPSNLPLSSVKSSPSRSRYAILYLRSREKKPSRRDDSSDNKFERLRKKQIRRHCDLQISGGQEAENESDINIEGSSSYSSGSNSNMIFTPSMLKQLGYTVKHEDFHGDDQNEFQNISSIQPVPEPFPNAPEPREELFGVDPAQIGQNIFTIRIPILPKSERRNLSPTVNWYLHLMQISLSKICQTFSTISAHLQQENPPKDQEE